jgi:hypothetical protein
LPEQKLYSQELVNAYDGLSVLTGAAASHISNAHVSSGTDPLVSTFETTIGQLQSTGISLLNGSLTSIASLIALGSGGGTAAGLAIASSFILGTLSTVAEMTAATYVQIVSDPPDPAFQNLYHFQFDSTATFDFGQPAALNSHLSSLFSALGSGADLAQCQLTSLERWQGAGGGGVYGNAQFARANECYNLALQAREHAASLLYTLPSAMQTAGYQDIDAGGQMLFSLFRSSGQSLSTRDLSTVFPPPPPPVTVAPEPSTWVVTLAGLIAVGIVSRRRVRGLSRTNECA